MTPAVIDNLPVDLGGIMPGYREDRCQSVRESKMPVSGLICLRVGLTDRRRFFSFSLTLYLVAGGGVFHSERRPHFALYLIFSSLRNR